MRHTLDSEFRLEHYLLLEFGVSLCRNWQAQIAQIQKITCLKEVDSESRMHVLYVPPLPWLPLDSRSPHENQGPRVLPILH